MNHASRIFWLKIVVICGLVSGLLASARLWSGERFFPLAPVLERLPLLPTPIGNVLFALLLVLLCFALITSKPSKLIFVAAGLMAVLAVFDQMRWQPWFYQYFFMLVTLGLFPWKYSDPAKQESVLNTNRIIVASLYFFGGLQKLNSSFRDGVFTWMAEPLTKLLPDPLQAFPSYLAPLVPFIEMAIGLGLLTRYRKYAVALAISMLCFVLFTLGPLGHNWNNVVWPWNIAMALFAAILFWQSKGPTFKEVFWAKDFPFSRVVLVLFAILPLFSFLNLWDSYLSASLYSGNTNSAEIYVSERAKQKLPAPIQAYVTKSGTDKNRLDFFNWSFDELNVPPYPEVRVYKDIAKGVCKYTGNEDVLLVVHRKPSLFKEGYSSNYNCSDL